MSLLTSGIAAILVLVVACSSDGDESDPTPAPAATPVPTAAPEPVATPVPEATPAANPDPTAVPTAIPTVTATPEPTPTPTPKPTPTAVISNIFEEFGFTLRLDEDASFASSDFKLRGWTEESASAQQGLLTFTYTGANVVFFWEPHSGKFPQTIVDSTYELQKLGQPDVDFTPISQGDLNVDGQEGRFGGFVADGGVGEDASGGLIGAWACDTATMNSLTVTGPDATALQIRFDRLISGFECGV